MGPRAPSSSRKRGRAAALVPAGGDGGRLTLSRVCVKCHALKVKCSGDIPCTRCVRLCLPCKPRVALTKGQKPPPPDALLATPMVDLAINRANPRANAELYLSIFHRLHAQHMISRDRAIQVLRMWRFLSIIAGSDVSLGMADRIAGSLNITRVDLEDAALLARTPNPGRRGDEETLQLQLRSEADRIKQTQAFRMEDDGRTPFMLLVLDGTRLVQASNAACDKFFRTSMQLCCDAVRHRSLMSLVFASIIAQEDRELWLRAVIVGLFGTRCDYATDFVKCLSNDGEVRLYISSTRQLVVDGAIAVVNKMEPCPVSRHVSGRPHHQAIAHGFKQRAAAAESGAVVGQGSVAGAAAAAGEAASIVLARAPYIGTLPDGKVPVPGFVCLPLKRRGIEDGEGAAAAAPLPALGGSGRFLALPPPPSPASSSSSSSSSAPAAQGQQDGGCEKGMEEQEQKGQAGEEEEAQHRAEAIFVHKRRLSPLPGVMAEAAPWPPTPTFTGPLPAPDPSFPPPPPSAASMTAVTFDDARPPPMGAGDAGFGAAEGGGAWEYPQHHHHHHHHQEEKEQQDGYARQHDHHHQQAPPFQTGGAYGSGGFNLGVSWASSSSCGASASAPGGAGPHGGMGIGMGFGPTMTVTVGGGQHAEPRHHDGAAALSQMVPMPIPSSSASVASASSVSAVGMPWAQGGDSHAGGTGWAAAAVAGGDAGPMPSLEELMDVFGEEGAQW